jgi:hypothetical protein
MLEIIKYCYNDSVVSYTMDEKQNAFCKEQNHLPVYSRQIKKEM